MKKTILTILSIISAACLLGGCSVSLGGTMDFIGDTGSSSSNSSVESPDENQGNESGEENQTPDDNENGDSAGNQTPDGSDNGGNTTEYDYTQFTASEKAMFTEYFGMVIPFAPNNEYYVEDESETYEGQYDACVCYYTLGNTQADFNAYKAQFSTANGYTYDGEETDDYGDTWYLYSKGDVCVDISYYYYEGDYVIDVYVYILSSTDDGGTETPDDDDSAELTSAKEILEAAYALASGKSLEGSYTLTGTVTKINKTGTDEACLTFVVSGYSQYPMYCYWLKGSGAGTLEVGDTITVTGTIKNYNGTIEFDHPQLNGYQKADDGESGDGDDSGNDDNDGGNSGYTYTSFTSSERNTFNATVGMVIPFMPTNEYFVETYEHEDEVGVNFYTYGNTSADFNAYRTAIFNSGFASAGTDEDEYGDTWYFYDKGEIYIDVAYYETDQGYCMDLYVYYLDENGGGNDGDDNESGDNEGDNEGGNSGSTNADLITNDGKGLPSSANGVYDVDFTDAKYVKNVADQGYYLGGCPTTGTPAVLVVPVEFSDVTAASKGYNIETIEKAFNGGTGDTDYYSVHDYYYISSYGKLDIQFTVLDSWFKPKNTSSYYARQTMDYYGSSVEIGDQMIMDEVLAYLEPKMDLSKFDSDSNGMIDAIVFVNTFEIDGDVTFQWAYRYWNLYTDDDGDYYEYDGVSANDYLWASYQFLYESANGDFYDEDAVNTYTFIHEFGHVLGADDYYDTSYNGGAPMGSYDVMDGMAGDHNAFTKFNYGWLTTSRLVVADSSITLTLSDFTQTGDTIIIANNWDDELGAYQEYYIVAYYTNKGLNTGVGGYFHEKGIVVYHVNASLYKETEDSEVYYDIYNNNTDASDEYGTEDNLIEYVLNGSEYVFMEGDSLSANVKDDSGNKISYTFTVDALEDGSATLTFTKNN